MAEARIKVSIEPAVRRALKVAAARKGVTMQYLVNKALIDLLKCDGAAG